MDLQINSAWSAVSAVLKNHFTFYDIKEIVGLAGYDKSQISHLVQRPGSSVSKGQLVTVIEQGLNHYNDSDKKHFLGIVVEEMLERNGTIEDQLEKYLSRLGWQIIDNSVVPMEILDREDLKQLDEVCREDLVKSATRFRDGDLSGSLSAACAAVDSITRKIYETHGLGDPGNTSFQERCKVALDATGIFSAIRTDLKDIDWRESGIVPFVKNFEGSLNQAAYVMQTLRANMADVHGTKPVLKPLVFDSVKWAQILIRLLSGEYSA